jgi:hypothetical protein
MSRRTPLPLLVLAMLVLANAGGVANATGTASADLSTDSGVAAYLSSKGLDARSFVIQRGPLNYAGPKCPGRSWNCTKKKKVVQVSSGRHGENRQECGPNGSLTTTNGGTKTIKCVVVQNSTSGKNRAKCDLDARSHPNIVLECEITQTNVNGDNDARIRQRVVQKKGADQRARLAALVTQTNGAGDNDSDLKQTIMQRSRDVAMASAPTQNQEGRFSARIAQSSETGSNFSRLFQDLDQTGKASGSSNIVQRQFGDHFGDVDQTNGGAEPSSRRSKSKSKSKSKSRSRSRAHQSERQRLKGPGQQIQIGPLFCCSTQLGGDSKHTKVEIRQNSKQTASESDADQSLTITGKCTTVGACEVLHRGRNNEDSIKVRERCRGTTEAPCSLFVVTTCTSEPDYYETQGCVSNEGQPSAKRRR